MNRSNNSQKDNITRTITPSKIKSTSSSYESHYSYDPNKMPYSYIIKKRSCRNFYTEEHNKSFKSTEEEEERYIKNTKSENNYKKINNGNFEHSNSKGSNVNSTRNSETNINKQNVLNNNKPKLSYLNDGELLKNFRNYIAKEERYQPIKLNKTNTEHIIAKGTKNNNNNGFDGKNKSFKEIKVFKKDGVKDIKESNANESFEKKSGIKIIRVSETLGKEIKQLFKANTNKNIKKGINGSLSKNEHFETNVKKKLIKKIKFSKLKSGLTEKKSNNDLKKLIEIRNNINEICKESNISLIHKNENNKSTNLIQSNNNQGNIIIIINNNGNDYNQQKKTKSVVKKNSNDTSSNTKKTKSKINQNNQTEEISNKAPATTLSTENQNNPTSTPEKEKLTMDEKICPNEKTSSELNSGKLIEEKSKEEININKELVNKKKQNFSDNIQKDNNLNIEKKPDYNNDDFPKEEIVEQKPVIQHKIERKRPVYTLPPAKKRLVSKEKLFDLITKYYDENFILEDDKEEEFKKLISANDNLDDNNAVVDKENLSSGTDKNNQ